MRPAHQSCGHSGPSEAQEGNRHVINQTKLVARSLMGRVRQESGLQQFSFKEKKTNFLGLIGLLSEIES